MYFATMSTLTSSAGSYINRNAINWSDLQNCILDMSWTNYHFSSSTQGFPGAIMNLVQGLKLLYNKCNAMQAEINALETPPVVDMASILAAMFAAEYAEIADFVGLNWAYQQVLWDQPFFPARYAAIVRAIRT